MLEYTLLPTSIRPPAARTFPSVRRVSVKNARGIVMLPTFDHVPVAGLNNSDPAVVVAQNSAHSRDVFPPVTRTFPFGSRIAECCCRPVCRLPVVFQMPVAGS